MTSLRFTLCLLVVGIVAAFPAAAPAATAAPSTTAVTSDPVSPTYDQGGSLDSLPPGYRVTGNQAKAIAERTSAAADVKRKYDNIKIAVFARNHRWEIDYYDANAIRTEVVVSSEGKVTKIWKGLAARAYYARGHYGGLLDRPWVFLPFGLLFLLPFFDPKRPFRILHLDLLVMLGFGVSFALFAHAHAEPAVWSVYPVLGYLLVRMLMIGFGKTKNGARGRAVPMLPTAVLAIGLLVLVGGRIGLNIAENEVIDVGYASVVGADRVTHKLPLYQDNEQHGDTYAPLNYVAYVPFELIFPWHGKWDSVPAAHAATIFFDVMTILGLFLLGRRLRAGPEGRRLGLALAWGWAAYPFTLWSVMENTNDSLIAMLLVYTLLALTSPAGRGALLGAATAAKFMPGAMLPLLALGTSEDGRRNWTDAIRTTVVCGAIFIFAVVVYLPDGGLREFWNCTLGFQLSRLPDFSPWGITDGYAWTQKVVLAGALGLSLFVGFFPRKRDLVQVAALSAALSIALQLPAGHWFYFYIPWFVPGVLVALFATHRDPVAKPDEERMEVEPDFPTHRFAPELSAS